MGGLFVPTCKVSGVQTNNCIVAATAMIHAASAPSFPPVTSIIKSLTLTQSHSVRLLTLFSVLRIYESSYDLVTGLLHCNEYQQPQVRGA